jgi:hypothetical protein
MIVNNNAEHSLFFQSWPLLNIHTDQIRLNHSLTPSISVPRLFINSSTKHQRFNIASAREKRHLLRMPLKIDFLLVRSETFERCLLANSVDAPEQAKDLE